jgi:hypothetical protein
VNSFAEFPARFEAYKKINKDTNKCVIITSFYMSFTAGNIHFLLIDSVLDAPVSPPKSKIMKNSKRAKAIGREFLNLKQRPPVARKHWN